MKKLLRKFKETYKSYDYNEQDIDILLDLLDIVLEMMNIVEMEDHGYMRKLSSFIQILSSGYSNTIMDAILIEDIYKSNIIPILDELENKYITKKFITVNTKEIVNGVPHVAVSVDKNILKLSEDFINNEVEFDTYKKAILEEMKRTDTDDSKCIIAAKRLNKPIPDDYDRSDISVLIDYIESYKDTDDPVSNETIFNMSKDIISILYNIYDSFTCGKSQEHKEEYLQDLTDLRNIMETISMHDNMSIQLLSDTIRSICYSLAHELNTNDVMPPSSIALLELKFKALEGIKFDNISLTI